MTIRNSDFSLLREGYLSVLRVKFHREPAKFLSFTQRKFMKHKSHQIIMMIDKTNKRQNVFSIKYLLQLQF